MPGVRLLLQSFLSLLLQKYVQNLLMYFQHVNNKAFCSTTPEARAHLYNEALPILALG